MKICKAALLTAILLLHNSTYNTQLILGDVTPTTAEQGCPTQVTTTFSRPINTYTYDRMHGIFWVGLSSGAGEYSISSFKRTLDSSETACFTPHTANTPLNNQSISSLNVTYNCCTGTPQIVGALAGSDNVFLLTEQNQVTQSDTLLTYTGISGLSGIDATSLNGFASNGSFMFVPVADGTFGDQGSGIAVVAINPITNALNQTAAVPGDTGIKAQELDNFSPFIGINNSSTGFPSILNDKAVLTFDQQLGRLYSGVSLTSNPAQIVGQGMRSIVVGQPTVDGTLPLFDFAPASAFNSNPNNIVGVTLNSIGQEEYLTVDNLAVMHADSGPSYLLLNGGNGQATNQLFALPLVDLGDPLNPMQGVLADKAVFNTTTRRYETPATNNASLTTSFDTFAQIGAGPLPIDATQTISNMMVIDDAVYVSIATTPDNANEAGLFYSQALFDAEGKIQSWTPWSKRAWPVCGFPDSTSTEQVTFFAVDAVTGKVIAVDNTKQTVRMTQWTTDTTPCANPCVTNYSLAAVLNRSLYDGSYSVLDLDQSTTGIGVSIPYRYALFGGIDKVDIALISTSDAASTPFDINPINTQPYPQTVTLNFCSPDVFQETTLPYKSGCVTSLEYSRRTTSQGETNYFFAGTQKGLFVFAQPNGDGFNVTDLGLLNNGILATGSWQHITNITGSVVDIASSGNVLYVLTFSSSCQTPFDSKVLLIPFTDNINTMFDPSNIYLIAQSGANSTSTALQKSLLFSALDIIQTDEANTQEQLVLATNNGIFQSQAAAGVQSVTNETDAAWLAIQDNSLFYGIGSVDNARYKSTNWPFNAQDSCCTNSFERSSIYQLNGTSNTVPFAFAPPFFNYALNPYNCCPATFFQKIAYFWSDGGRRFFIVSPTNARISGVPCCGKKQCCCNNSCQQIRALQVTPYNICEWGITDPSQTLLKDCILRSIADYYWVRLIGMTGIVFAGTNDGVVALQ